jgi:hypothetical protein
MSLTKGWPRVCVDFVKGSDRVHSRGFQGDDPGWRGLTAVGRFDSADSISNINNTNQKPGASH